MHKVFFFFEKSLSFSSFRNGPRSASTKRRLVSSTLVPGVRRPHRSLLLSTILSTAASLRLEASNSSGAKVAVLEISFHDLSCCRSFKVLIQEWFTGPFPTKANSSKENSEHRLYFHFDVIRLACELQ